MRIDREVLNSFDFIKTISTSDRACVRQRGEALQETVSKEMIDSERIEKK